MNRGQTKDKTQFGENVGFILLVILGIVISVIALWFNFYYLIILVLGIVAGIVAWIFDSDKAVGALLGGFIIFLLLAFLGMFVVGILKSIGVSVL